MDFESNLLITIDTMLNFDSDFDGHGHGDGTCKHALSLNICSKLFLNKVLVFTHSWEVHCVDFIPKTATMLQQNMTLEISEERKSLQAQSPLIPRLS